MKITRKYLEENGWVSKYKSIHNRWCKDGVCIDQASDEDGYGDSIPEVDEFSYKYADIETVEELNTLLNKQT